MLKREPWRARGERGGIPQGLLRSSVPPWVAMACLLAGGCSASGVESDGARLGLGELGLSLAVPGPFAVSSTEVSRYEVAYPPLMGRTQRSMVIGKSSGSCPVELDVASERPPAALYLQSRKQALGRGSKIGYAVQSLGGGSGGEEYLLSGCWVFRGDSYEVECRWQEEGAPSRAFCLETLRGARKVETRLEPPRLGTNGALGVVVGLPTASWRDAIENLPPLRWSGKRVIQLKQRVPLQALPEALVDFRFQGADSAFLPRYLVVDLDPETVADGRRVRNGNIYLAALLGRAPLDRGRVVVTGSGSQETYESFGQNWPLFRCPDGSYQHSLTVDYAHGPTAEVCGQLTRLVVGRFGSEVDDWAAEVARMGGIEPNDDCAVAVAAPPLMSDELCEGLDEHLELLLFCNGQFFRPTADGGLWLVREEELLPPAKRTVPCLPALLVGLAPPLTESLGAGEKNR